MSLDYLDNLIYSDTEGLIEAEYHVICEPVSISKYLSVQTACSLITCTVHPFVETWFYHCPFMFVTYEILHEAYYIITFISHIYIHICMIAIRFYTCDIHVHDCSVCISFPTVVYF